MTFSSKSLPSHIFSSLNLDFLTPWILWKGDGMRKCRLREVKGWKGTDWRRKSCGQPRISEWTGSLLSRLNDSMDELWALVLKVKVPLPIPSTEANSTGRQQACVLHCTQGSKEPLGGCCPQHQLFAMVALLEPWLKSLLFRLFLDTLEAQQVPGWDQQASLEDSLPTITSLSLQRLIRPGRGLAMLPVCVSSNGPVAWSGMHLGLLTTHRRSSAIASVWFLELAKGLT